MTIVKVKEHHKCSVNTMSEGCFKQINDYLSTFENLVGNSVEETKKNIMATKYFSNGCFTYLQAQGFAEYYHQI